jgi:hypothetical protein
MKFKIEVELSEADQRRVMENSIARVLNNAIFVGKQVETSEDEELAERASILWQDCEELISLTRNLWEAVRDAIFKANLK